MKYLTLEEAGIFHGHLGPFLALGYRAGELARNILKPVNEHDLFARLKLPLKTPYTCIADGVQCSTKCTIGKLNIVLEDSGDPRNIVLEFTSRSTGRRVVLRVREGVVERMRSFSSLEDGVKWVLSRKVEELFEIVERP